MKSISVQQTAQRSPCGARLRQEQDIGKREHAAESLCRREDFRPRRRDV